MGVSRATRFSVCACVTTIGVAFFASIRYISGIMESGLLPDEEGWVNTFWRCRSSFLVAAVATAVCGVAPAGERVGDSVMSSPLTLALLLFFPGLIVGSFLTRLIHRTPYEEGLRSPDTCPSCGGRIAAKDVVPLASWFLLKGRCRACRAAIPWRYPAIEAATGLAWAVQGWRLALLPADGQTVAIGLLELAFVSALIATAVIDWDCLIILDEISLGGAAVALAASPLLPRLHHAERVESFAAYFPELYLLFGTWPAWARSLGASVVGLAAGLGFSLLVYWFGNLAFKERIEEAQAEDPEVDSALGLGDVKLMAFFGAFLGWRAVFGIFLVGAVTGALGGIVLRIATGEPEGGQGVAGLRNRWRTGSSFLPFGPFLVLGAYLALLTR